MQKRSLGWLFIFIGLLPILTFLLWGNEQYIFWFSNQTFFIMGLALLFNSRFWVFAELCLGFLPELVWSFDFLVNLFTGISPLGITSYMFKNGGFDWLHLYSLQHILFVPLGLYALYLLGGPVRFAWIGSIIHSCFLWAVSFLFSPDYNLNCVYHKCAFDLPFYKFTWPSLVVVHVFLVYFLIFVLWKKKKIKK